jgi:hypothetical protein
VHMGDGTTSAAVDVENTLDGCEQQLSCFGLEMPLGDGRVGGGEILAHQRFGGFQPVTTRRAAVRARDQRRTASESR